MTAIIELRGLTKSFGPSVVLDAIDLEVPRGTVFALLGPNGAGKTTLINILSTLVVPDSGTATIAGYDVVRDAAAVKRHISLTGQSAAVDDVLTGRENLELMATLLGLTRAERGTRTTELLARFELSAAADTRVRTYSGGMRRRLDLAISLLTTPTVLFLDEPTTGLDTRSRAGLWSDIRALAAAGTTVLLTTQYLEEADQLADTVAVLDHGRIIASGSPAELKSRVGGELLSLLDSEGDVVREIPTDGSIRGLKAALALVGDADADTIALRRPTMDDVFLSLTGSSTSEKEAS